MNFNDNVSYIQELFHKFEFDTVNELYPLDQIGKRNMVLDCIMLAKRGCFEVIYVEVKANSESIAGDLARSHLTPCLVITRINTVYVFTTINYRSFKPIHSKTNEGQETRLDELVEFIGEKNDDPWEMNSRLVDFMNTMNKF